MNTYTPDAFIIQHPVIVDFGSRHTIQHIHLVQYDDRLTLIAVQPFAFGSMINYTPATTDFRIRFGKKDGTFVYISASGYNETSKDVYFIVSRQMTVNYGCFYPIVEMLINNAVVGSSPICVEIDRNPIQDSDIESQIDAPALKGNDGITPEFSIGTVETVSPTMDADVTLTGTKEAPVLNFKIPKGKDGGGGSGGSNVTKLSELEDDATHRTVTDVEKASWNAKSDFSPPDIGTATNGAFLRVRNGDVAWETLTNVAEEGA